MRSGKRGLWARIYQVGAVEGDKLRQLIECQDAVDQKHLVIGHAERALDEMAQFRRHRGVDFETDDEPPAGA